MRTNQRKGAAFAAIAMFLGGACGGGGGDGATRGHLTEGSRFWVGWS